MAAARSPGKGNGCGRSVQVRDAPAERLDVLPDLLVLVVARIGVLRLRVSRRRARRETQVRLQVPQGGGVVVQVVGQQPAVPQLGRGRGIEGEEQLSDGVRLGERAHADVDALQVDEHADDDLRLGGPCEHATVEPYLVAGVRSQQLPAVELREDGAAVEGVDDQLAAVDGRGRRTLGNARMDAQQEVTGKIDAVDAKTGPPGHLDVDEGERDRDALASIDDVPILSPNGHVLNEPNLVEPFLSIKVLRWFSDSNGRPLQRSCSFCHASACQVNIIHGQSLQVVHA